MDVDLGIPTRVKNLTFLYSLEQGFVSSVHITLSGGQLLYLGLILLELLEDFLLHPIHLEE